MEAACEKEGIRFYRPSPIFCTDNAAMIGVAAYYEYQKGTRHGWDLNACLLYTSGCNFRHNAAIQGMDGDLG